METTANDPLSLLSWFNLFYDEDYENDEDLTFLRHRDGKWYKISLSKNNQVSILEIDALDLTLSEFEKLLESENPGWCWETLGLERPFDFLTTYLKKYVISRNIKKIKEEEFSFITENFLWFVSSPIHNPTRDEAVFLLTAIQKGVYPWDI